MLKNCASLSTIVLLNVLNELAKCTKEGFIPLSMINSEDDAHKYLRSHIIYDDKEDFYKDDMDIFGYVRYRIVSSFGYDDNDRPIPNLYYNEMFENIDICFYSYDEDSNTGGMVFLEEDSSGTEIFCVDGEWCLNASVNGIRFPIVSGI